MSLKIKKQGDGHQNPKVEEVKKVLMKEESVRLNANIPKSFYKELKQFSIDSDMSITQTVIEALTEYMNNKK